MNSNLIKKLTLELYEHQLENLTDLLRERLETQLDCASDAFDENEVESAAYHVSEAQMALQLERVVSVAVFRAAHPVAGPVNPGTGVAVELEIGALEQPTAKA
jgi:hypothetical protein